MATLLIVRWVLKYADDMMREEGRPQWEEGDKNFLFNGPLQWEKVSTWVLEKGGRTCLKLNLGHGKSFGASVGGYTLKNLCFSSHVKGPQWEEGDKNFLFNGPLQWEKVSTWVLEKNGGESCLKRALKGVSPKVGWGRGYFEKWTSRGNPPVTFAIAACETQNVNVTVLPCFGLSEGCCITAKDTWGKIVQLLKDGHFDQENFDRPTKWSLEGFGGDGGLEGEMLPCQIISVEKRKLRNGNLLSSQMSGYQNECTIGSAMKDFQFPIHRGTVSVLIPSILSLNFSTETSRENPPVTFAIAACETQNINVTVLPCFGLSEGSCITTKDTWGKIVPAHRYTEFYGTSERLALDLAHDALTSMYIGIECAYSSLIIILTEGPQKWSLEGFGGYGGLDGEMLPWGDEMYFEASRLLSLPYNVSFEIMCWNGYSAAADCCIFLVLSYYRKSDDQGISSWEWNLSGQHSTYCALFPRAWTIYDGEPDPELKVSCRLLSPFIPHNYRESSLPIAVYVYTVCKFSFLASMAVVPIYFVINTFRGFRFLYFLDSGIWYKEVSPARGKDKHGLNLALVVLNFESRPRPSDFAQVSYRYFTDFELGERGRGTFRLPMVGGAGVRTIRINLLHSNRDGSYSELVQKGSKTPHHFFSVESAVGLITVGEEASRGMVQKKMLCAVTDAKLLSAIDDAMDDDTLGNHNPHWARISVGKQTGLSDMSFANVEIELRRKLPQKSSQRSESQSRMGMRKLRKLVCSINYERTSRENPPVTFAITACETQNLPKDGHFDQEDLNSRPSMLSSQGDTHCVAVSASTRVEPHEKCNVAFAVAWSPNKFFEGKSHHRRIECAYSSLIIIFTEVYDIGAAPTQDPIPTILLKSPTCGSRRTHNEVLERTLLLLSEYKCGCYFQKTWGKMVQAHRTYSRFHGISDIAALDLALDALTKMSGYQNGKLTFSRFLQGERLSPSSNSSPPREDPPAALLQSAIDELTKHSIGEIGVVSFARVRRRRWDPTWRPCMILARSPAAAEDLTSSHRCCLEVDHRRWGIEVVLGDLAVATVGTDGNECVERIETLERERERERGFVDDGEME
ncbi:hypothetical protein RHSIM_Rhsim01G0146100 [Rhododendron simsii]|uniref:Glycosyl-hydrolase family 116 N-terminal domain-containing protein n=1 Tax=Rhododendron simsii TaxID=118357 RepID=A0A834HL30_RHOSS|nr:hypothetical protein RHSIM_Rhsim01G0146100 [Rhododendron simsii]